MTVADLCNEYLGHHEERRDKGEISPRTFQTLYATCANIVKALGKTRTVASLSPDDFAKLRAKLAETRKAVALRNEMQRCRGVFRFAMENGLVHDPIRYGNKFEKPKLKQVRREEREAKEKHGSRMLQADEIRQLLGEAKQPLKAMILLACNYGFGQADLSSLPLSAIDLDRGIIEYPRRKTEVDRICPLWPETVEAIRDWLPNRPKPKNKADSRLLFLTVRGNPFVKTTKSGAPIDGIGQEFSKVLRRLSLKRRGVGFYALRHSFRTVADETLDPVAIDLIMGHVDASMASHYRERIGEDRLRKVTEHVRAWLFPPDEKRPEDYTDESKGRAGSPDPSDEDEEPPTLRLFAG